MTPYPRFLFFFCLPFSTGSFFCLVNLESNFLPSNNTTLTFISYLNPFYLQHGKRRRQFLRRYVSSLCAFRFFQAALDLREGLSLRAYRAPLQRGVYGPILPTSLSYMSPRTLRNASGGGLGRMLPLPHSSYLMRFSHCLGDNYDYLGALGFVLWMP